MSKKSLFLILLLSYCLTSIRGQQNNNEVNLGSITRNYNVVQGVVVDSLTSQPLHGATISVVNSRGSFHTATNRDGKFKFTVDRTSDRDLRIEITYVGYKIFRAEHSVATTIVDVGKVLMKVDTKEMDAVTVMARAALFKNSGDTLIFFPSALRMRKGSNVLDVLKKMPGVEVSSSGNVKVGGKDIERTYVNGKLIFGEEDPSKALVYINSEDLLRILAFDETDEASEIVYGKQNARKRRVLNVETFDFFSKSINADVFGSYGADVNKDMSGSRQDRYLLGTGLDFASEKKGFTLNYMTDNIEYVKPLFNNQNDMIGSVDQKRNKNEYTRKSVFGASFFLTKNKWKIYNKYTYNDKFVRSSSIIHNDYFAVGGEPSRLYSDTMSLRNNISTHNVESTASVMTNRVNSTFVANAIFTDTKLKNLSSSLLSSEGTTLDNIYTENRNNTDEYKILLKNYSSIGLSNKSSLRTTIIANFVRKDPDGWRRDSSMIVPSGNRHITLSGTDNSSNLHTSLQYTYNTAKAGSLSVKMNLNYDNSKQTNIALDKYTGKIDSTLTRNITNNTVSLLPAISHKITKGKFEVEAGVAFQTDIVGLADRFPTYNHTNNFFGVCPEISIQYGDFASPKGSWAFLYVTTASAPSASLLSDKLNYDSPLILDGGNADLKREYSHTLSMIYSLYNIEKQSSLSVGATAIIRNNMIAQKRIYFANSQYLPNYNYTTIAGSTLTTYENVNGTQQFSGYISYGVRIAPIKVLFNGRLLYVYNKSPMFIGSDKVELSSHSPLLEVSLTSNFSDKFEVMVSNSLTYDYSDVVSDLTDKSLLNLSSASLSVDFLKRMFVNVSYNFYTNHSYTYSEDRLTTHNLNASLGCRLFKRNRGEISISGFDILNNNKSLTSTLFADYRQNRWITQTPGYVMLNFKYKFQKNK